MRIKRLSLAVCTAIISAFGLTARADEAVNLILNGEFIPNEGVTASVGYTTIPNLSNPFSLDNPFYANLVENRWYGYIAGNSAKPGSMASDTRLGWFSQLTHTSGEGGSAAAGKGGVLCSEFTVPEGEGGTYELKYSARNISTGYSKKGEASLVTAYVLKRSEVGTSSLWPVSNTTKMKKLYPNLVRVEQNGNGKLVNSIMLYKSTWSECVGEVRLEPGDYTLILMNLEHSAETTVYSRVYTGFYLDDVSLKKNASVVNVEVAVDENKAACAVTNQFNEAVTGTVESNAFFTVYATPNDGYGYEIVPAGWTKSATTISRMFKANADLVTVNVPDPYKLDYVPVSISVDTEKVSYTATSALGPVGETILSNVTVTVVATATADGYDYMTVPAGWSRTGARTIARDYLVDSNPFAVEIPSPVKTLIYDHIGWYKSLGNEEYVVAFTNTTEETISYSIPENVLSIDYLVVAGGGAGAGGASAREAGGGGAGGMLTNVASLAVTAGSTLTISVGKGGVPSGNGRIGTSGENSSLSGEGFDAIVAIGGGGGGCDDGSSAKLYNGQAGGSGGGGSGGGSSAANRTGGEGTVGQGHDGGSTVAAKNVSGSGGGGAGSAGGNGDLYAKMSGVGGEGLLCNITGEDLYYAAGGGGGNNGYAGCLGGSGIGGQGGGSDNSNKGQPGKDGTGSGGGGTGYLKALGGKGGDGVVIVRYAVKSQLAISCDSTKATYAAVCGEQSVVDGDYVNYNAEIEVVATPRKGYEYTDDVVPAEWTKNQDGTITRSYVASSNTTTIDIPDPKQTGIVEDLVSVVFEAASFATYEASIGGIPLTAEQVVSNAVIDVVATAAEHYEYAVLPENWSWVTEGKEISASITASTDPTTIVIPEATPIMVEVVVDNSLGENVVYTISTNGVVIAQPAYVQEGTEVTITVTPQGIYEYSKAPEGWTLSDGTITRTYMVDDEFESVVVPTENFRKQQVTVKFTAKGVSYVATNLTTNLRIKNGGSADVDAQISVIVRRYSEAYTFETPLPQGWVQVDENVVTGLVAAVDTPISLPSATWTPTDGELIENGDFEYFDPNEYVTLSGFPSSMAGSWSGKTTSSIAQWNCYGLWQKGVVAHGDWTVNGSAKSGTYAAGLNTSSAGSIQMTVTFKTPTDSSRGRVYEMNYYTKVLRNNSYQSKGSLVITLLQDNKEISTVDDCTPNSSWQLRTQTITGLEPDTTYTLKFAVKSNSTSFAIDDVSLKMMQPKSTVIVIQ